MSEAALIPCDRPLTDHERQLVAWRIDHGESGDRQKLHGQIPEIWLRERCTCGCPTVYFALNGKPVPRKGVLLISDHLATVAGMEVGIMLFQTDGHLSSLEGLLLWRNGQTVWTARDCHNSGNSTGPESDPKPLVGASPRPQNGVLSNLPAPGHSDRLRRGRVSGT
jgi:hypothetical protein